MLHTPAGQALLLPLFTVPTLAGVIGVFLTVTWTLHTLTSAPACPSPPQKDGDAKPQVLADIASSLADMLFAQQRLEEARSAVVVAIDAAERAANWGLMVKLSNNMGAVLRRLNNFAESKELHTRALEVHRAPIPLYPFPIFCPALLL